MAKPPLQLPFAAVPSFFAWVRKAKVKGAIIGALAVAVRGRARSTGDLDVLIALEEKRWPAFVAQGERLGFRPRVPNAIALAHETRVLLVQHEKSAIDVDILLAGIPYEKQVIDRATKAKIGKTMARVATIEDLIVLKAVANRPMDLDDIQNMLDIAKRVDYLYVRQWTRHFADLLERAEIRDAIESMLQKHEKRQRKKK